MMKRKYPLTNLPFIRKRFGTTQKELADYCGCTPQYISAIETGKNALDYMLALKMAKFFSTTPDALFKDDFDTILKEEIRYKNEEEQKQQEQLRAIHAKEMVNRNMQHNPLQHDKL